MFKFFVVFAFHARPVNADVIAQGSCSLQMSTFMNRAVLNYLRPKCFPLKIHIYFVVINQFSLTAQEVEEGNVIPGTVFINWKYCTWHVNKQQFWMLVLCVILYRMFGAWSDTILWGIWGSLAALATVYPYSSRPKCYDCFNMFFIFVAFMKLPKIIAITVLFVSEIAQKIFCCTLQCLFNIFVIQYNWYEEKEVLPKPWEMFKWIKLNNF